MEGQHGMLDDEWWHSFTSDAGDYELGAPVGESGDDATS